MSLLFLENCAHVICRPCFKKLVRVEFVKKGQMECPQCEEAVPEYEIQGVIGEEQYKHMKKEAALAHAAEELKEQAEKGKAKCKCGEVSDVVEAEVDYNAVDEQGE